MSEPRPEWTALSQSAEPAVAAAIETLVLEAGDAALNRVNPLSFSAQHGFDEQAAIAAFLYAARLGLFDMSWNVLCPSCGGVLDARSELRDLRSDHYRCSFCSADYEPTLDEMVEVTFTVNARVRTISAHNPERLSPSDYFRLVFSSSGLDLPEDLDRHLQGTVIEAVELPPGEKALISFTLPPGSLIIFDPVTHATQFVEASGNPARERQSVPILIDDIATAHETLHLQPGPIRLSLENRTDRRALPSVWLAGDALDRLLSRRRPFLTAKRLLSNQTFRDIFKTGTLDPHQRFRITSLTFLFTDLKGSTELYERIGDLAAYDFVRGHFRVLHEIVQSQAGAVVKTIGDAVMATFPTPDRALTAALAMRGAMLKLNAERPEGDLMLKIGIHEGPCLAVTLNERQDYFGQTVNIASRVQNLAESQSIFATDKVVGDAESGRLLDDRGLTPKLHPAVLRGIASEMTIYEIP